MAENPTEDEYTFLCMLAAGEGFNDAVTVFSGDRGPKAAFSCVTKGWVDRGQITKSGRELVTKPLKTTKYQITILSEPRKTEV